MIKFLLSRTKQIPTWHDSFADKKYIKGGIANHPRTSRNINEKLHKASPPRKEIASKLDTVAAGGEALCNFSLNRVRGWFAIPPFMCSAAKESCQVGICKVQLSRNFF